MSYKYNVLWLDDEPIKIMDNICNDYPDIDFEKIDYVDVCENIIETQSARYHAVILDANGIKSKSPESPAGKSGFLPLVEKVIEKQLLLYIYSGQLLRATDGDAADVVMEVLNKKGLRENENIFFKSGGPYQMIDKIKKDLDNKYNYYVGYEYLLSIFSNGWIESKYKSACLDPIMTYYKENDYLKDHGNQMRKLTEQMLQKLNETLDLINDKDLDERKWKKIVEKLKNSYPKYSQMMSGPLYHMIDLPNEESHKVMSEIDRKLFFVSDFSTFFVVSHWFYKFMSNLCQINDTLSTKSTSAGEQKKPVPECPRSGVFVKTHKEQDGRTYFDAKIEVTGDGRKVKGKLYVTGIGLDNTKKTWFAKYNVDIHDNCQEDGNNIKPSTFTLGDCLKNSK